MSSQLSDLSPPPVLATVHRVGLGYRLIDYDSHAAVLHLPAETVPRISTQKGESAWKYHSEGPNIEQENQKVSIMKLT